MIIFMRFMVKTILTYSEGMVTVTDIVMEANLPMKKAESILNKLVDNNRVVIEVRDNGIIEYEFREIMEILKRK